MKYSIFFLKCSILEFRTVSSRLYFAALVYPGNMVSWPMKLSVKLPVAFKQELSLKRRLILEELYIVALVLNDKCQRKAEAFVGNWIMPTNAKSVGIYSILQGQSRYLDPRYASDSPLPFIFCTVTIGSEAMCSDNLLRQNQDVYFQSCKPIWNHDE